MRLASGMRHFANLRIGVKVGLGFGFVLALLLIVAAISAWSQQVLRQSIDDAVATLDGAVDTLSGAVGTLDGAVGALDGASGALGGAQSAVDETQSSLEDSVESLRTGQQSLQDAERAYAEYRGVTQASDAVNRALVKMLTTQLHVRGYIATNNPAMIDLVQRSHEETLAAIDEALAAVENPTRQEQLGAMREQVSTYGAAFTDVVEEQERFNQIYDAILSPQGAAAEEALWEIMESARSDSDTDASYHAGVTLRHLLLARLFTARYLVQNAEEDYERALVELEAFEAAADELSANIYSATRRSLAQRMMQAVRMYEAGLEEIHNAIAARNELIAGSLDVIGPVLAAAVAQFQTDIGIDRYALESDASTAVLQAGVAMTGTDTAMGQTSEAMVATVAAMTETSTAMGETTTAVGNTRIAMDDTSAAMDDTTAAMGAAVGDMQQMIVVVLVVSAAGLLAGVLVAALIARGISRPIVAMTTAMDALSGGDTGIEVPAIGRSDEVGHMAGAVQVFKDNMLRNQELAAAAAEEQAARDRHAAQLEQLASDFDGEVTGVLHTVTDAAGQMRDTASRLSQTAEEASTQTSAVAASAEQASGNVQNVAAAAEELGRAIDEIAQQVAHQSSIAGSAVATAESGDAKVLQLSEAARQIGEVVALITNIAEQTNLLALNATIEAARAGDAGKGFAVVASEVKALANQTSKATEEIAQQVATIQASTDETVEAIREIGGRIQEMSHISATVAAAVEEQSAATQEISRHVAEAAVGTQDVTTTIVSVTEAAQQTGGASGDVLNASEALASQADTLQSVVRRFLEDVRAA